MIDKLKLKHPVQMLCNQLDVAISGYSAYGNGKSASPRKQEDLHLLTHILAAHARGRGIYGPLKIQSELKTVGIQSQTAGANIGLSTSSSGSGSSSGSVVIGGVPTLSIQFAQQQLNLLNQAYASLTDSIYSALVLQTRLKPYLDLVDLVIDNNGIHLDATALNATLTNKTQTDPLNGLSDLLDLDKYAKNLLADTNWEGLASFDTLYDSLPKTPALTALLNEFNLTNRNAVDATTGAILANNDNVYLNSTASIVLAGAGNDYIFGGTGDDRLYGQADDDVIYAGSGNDLVSGGAGNDSLHGQYGADTYVFYGNDTITDSAEGGVQLDRVQLFGLTAADVTWSTDSNDNLTLTIKDTGETLTIPRYGDGWWNGDYRNGVGKINFADGTMWSIDDAYRASVDAATDYRRSLEISDFNALLIRVCQPCPSDLKYARTSASKRMPVYTLGATALGRPGLRLVSNSLATSSPTKPANTSVAGLNCFKSANVTSRTSPVALVNGLWVFISRYLSFVSTTQTNHPNAASNWRKTQHMQTFNQITKRHQSLLGVMVTAINSDACALPIKISDAIKRQFTLGQVFSRLSCVKVDNHSNYCRHNNYVSQVFWMEASASYIAEAANDVEWRVVA